MNQWAAILLLRLRLLRRAGRAGGNATFAISIAMMGLLAFWVAAGLTGHLRASGPEKAAAATHSILAGIWMLWATSPLLGYPFSEFHDVAKLLVYPVSHRRAFLASAAASLVSPSVLPIGGVAIAILSGLPGTPPVVAFRAILLVAFFLHASLLAQTIHLAGLTLFSRRRLRDLAIVAAPLVSLALLLAFRRSFGLPGSAISNEPLAGTRHSEALWALPPRWLTEVLVDPLGGPLLLRAALLLGFAAFTAIVVRIGTRFQEKAFYGDVLDLRQRSGRAPGTGPGSRLARPFLALLPRPTRAVLVKEWRVLRRDPILASQILRQTTLLLFVFAVPFIEPAPPDSDVYALYFLSLLVFLLFSQSQLLSNLFGTDGPAVEELFTRGQDRKHVFVGKNLCHLAFYVTLETVVLGAFAILFGQTPLLGPYLFIAVWMTVLNVAAGNVGSIFLSFPLSRMAARRAIEQQPERQEGCARMAVRMFAGMVGLAAALPVAVLTWLGEAYVGWVGYAFAALYALVGWGASLFVASGLLESREEDLIEAMEP